MKRCVYSNEFKEQAVRLSHQRENTKELADEPGITFSTCISGVHGLTPVQQQE